MTSGWRAALEAEDKIAADRFRGAASRVAGGAAKCADDLARAARLNLDSPAGAAEACAVFTEVRRWEVQAWGRLKELTRGCRPGLGVIWPERPTFPPADGETLAGAESKLREIALRLDGAARGTASVLMVPEDIRPPKHAGLKLSINAEVLADDLLALRDRGARTGVEAAAEDVRQWLSDVREALDGLEAAPDSSGPGAQFLDLIQGIEAAGNPLVGNPVALRHAYVLLGVDYVMEVHGKMRDYARASGQGDKGFIIHMEADNINVGQIGETITNIESTIQVVADQGDSRTAAALEAVKQAIQDEPGLDGETRSDLLDQVKFLAESAQQEPAERNRGVGRRALAALKAAATTGTVISEAMTAWGDVLHKILS